MRLTLPEFDEYARKLVSKAITDKEDYKSLSNPSNLLDYIRADVDSSFNIKLKPRQRGQMLIKSNRAPNVSYDNGFTLLDYTTVDKKLPVSAKYAKLLENLPELSITIRDVNFASIYLTNKSNLRDFAKDIKRITLVSTMPPDELSKLGDKATLYISRMPNNSFAMKYNPKFIARTIVEDYIYHYSGVRGFSKYAGAFSSFCFMIGHELMHYRNNHLNQDTMNGIAKMFYPPKLKTSPHWELNNKLISAIVVPEVQAFPEYQNNALMSSILDMGTPNGGMGRVHIQEPKSYSGMYSGYLVMSKSDSAPHSNQNIIEFLRSKNEVELLKMASDGWSFSDLRIDIHNGAIGISSLREIASTQRTIIWPFVTPYPTDDDFNKFITLFFLTYIPVSKDALKPKKKPVVKGYQPGDMVIVKSSGLRGIVTSVDQDSGEVIVEVQDSTPYDRLKLLIEEIDDKNLNSEARKAIDPIIQKHNGNNGWWSWWDLINITSDFDLKVVEQINKELEKVLSNVKTKT